MVEVVSVVCAVSLVAALRWSLRRRGDVVSYHHVDASADRVGSTWLPTRHGGR